MYYVTAKQIVDFILLRGTQTPVFVSDYLKSMAVLWKSLSMFITTFSRYIFTDVPAEYDLADR